MRRTRFALATLCMSLLSTAVFLAGAHASGHPDAGAETPATVERIRQSDGTALLRGVTSPSQLVAACGTGKFCAYHQGDGYAREWGCGWRDTPAHWTRGGWWVNNLPRGGKDRVMMLNDMGVAIYTTPRPPSKDATADWNPVAALWICVP